MRIVGLAASRLPLISDAPLQYKQWVIPVGVSKLVLFRSTSSI
jgi:hypothetical protein